MSNPFGVCGKITVEMDNAQPADHWTLPQIKALNGRKATARIVLTSGYETEAQNFHLMGDCEISGFDNSRVGFSFGGPYSRYEPVNAHIYQEHPGTVTIEEVVEAGRLNSHETRSFESRKTVITLDSIAMIMRN